MPMVRSCLDGINATVFAYGQSGTGKTHTMVGASALVRSKSASEADMDVAGANVGLIPRTMHELFAAIAAQQAKAKQNGNEANFHVSVSFIELVNDGISDLRKLMNKYAKS